MMGEELNAAEVTERGLLGDRAYALVDTSDGKAATAKNPRSGRTSLISGPRSLSRCARPRACPPSESSSPMAPL